MVKADLYNQKGEKKGDVTLPKSIFEIEGGEGLVHSYLIYQQKSARSPIAHVLTKGEVRGGGRAFGPKKWQNFTIMMPKQMRRKALFQILSIKAKDGKILALDQYEVETPKTKDFATMLKKMPIKRNVLIVGNREEKSLRVCSQNLANAKTIMSGYLNPVELLKFDTVLFTETALKDLQTTYHSA